MAIPFALFNKIISLLLLFRLLIASIGSKTEFNALVDALKSPLKTHAFSTLYLRVNYLRIFLFLKLLMITIII
jgi:hypothetical protein